MAARKKQTTRQEAIDKFKPSTGNEAYLNPKSKVAIRAEGWDEIRSLLSNAAFSLVKVGQVLNTIRETHPSDNAFKKQRDKELPDFSADRCSRLMQIARDPEMAERVEKGLIGWSVAIELMALPPAVKDELLDKVDDPDEKTPTVKDIRGAKDEDSPPTSPDPKPDPESAATRQAKIDRAEDNEGDKRPNQMRSAMMLNIHQRCREFNDSDDRMGMEWAFVLIGLSPYFEDDDRPNQDSADILYQKFWSDLGEELGGDEAARDALMEAGRVIDEYYNQF